MERREPPPLIIPERRTRADRAVAARASEESDAPPRLRSLRDVDVVAPQRSLLSWIGTFAVFAAIAICCILAAGATFIMIAAPTDLVRDQLIAQIKARTGRTLVLAGSTSFTLFPSVGLRMTEVSLSAPPDMNSAPLVAIKRLAADVRLLPLLQREVVIERLVLGEPTFELVVDGQGRRSWDFASAGEPLHSTAAIQLAQATQRGNKTDGLPPELKDFVRNSSDPTRAGQTAGLSGLGELILADTRIEQGTVRFLDQRSGTRFELQRINAEVGLKSLASPLDAKGTLAWQGETLKVDARLTTLKSLLEGRSSRFTGTISGSPLEVSYDGTLALRGTVELEGNLTAKAASVRTLALWLGRELPASAGFGHASIAGTLKASGSSVGLDAAVITLDGTSINGTLSVDTVGVRPLIKANLRLADLDLDRYRSTGPPTLPLPVTPRRTERPSQSQPTGPAIVDAPARTIEDLLLREGATAPQVRGFSRRDGWSSEPLDLTALALVDAEAKLSIGKLVAGGLRLSSSQVLVALKSSALRVTLEDSQLYEGRGKGFVTIDATKSPMIGANLLFDGVSALPLLQDGVGFESLAGRGRISLALAGQGLSEKDIVESLRGRADLTIANGAVVGWDIEKLLRSFGQARFPGLERVADDRTEFSELAASFQIANGVATNKDLRLASALLHMTGAGIIELPARRLDYVVRPKLVTGGGGQPGPLQPGPGQSGVAQPGLSPPGANAPDVGGIEIPVRVHGPWDRPSYAPDLQAAMRDPDKVIDAVKQFTRQLDSKGGLDGAKRLLEQFLKR